MYHTVAEITSHQAWQDIAESTLAKSHFSVRSVAKGASRSIYVTCANEPSFCRKKTLQVHERKAHQSQDPTIVPNEEESEADSADDSDEEDLTSPNGSIPAQFQAGDSSQWASFRQKVTDRGIVDAGPRSLSMSEMMDANREKMYSPQVQYPFRGSVDSGQSQLQRYSPYFDQAAYQNQSMPQDYGYSPTLPPEGPQYGPGHNGPTSAPTSHPFNSVQWQSNRPNMNLPLLGGQTEHRPQESPQISQQVPNASFQAYHYAHPPPITTQIAPQRIVASQNMPPPQISPYGEPQSPLSIEQQQQLYYQQHFYNQTDEGAKLSPLHMAGSLQSFDNSGLGLYKIYEHSVTDAPQEFMTPSARAEFEMSNGF